MDQWIARQNINRFEEILKTVEPNKRHTVEILLLAEKQKLAAIESKAEACQQVSSVY